MLISKSALHAEGGLGRLSDAMAWFSNARVVLWLAPGAGHTNASAIAPEEFRKRVLDWFKAHR
jgi:hypothetical protein